MSQQKRLTNPRSALWREYANSEQEYEDKKRQKEMNEMRLSAHEDLLSFYLLKKSASKTLNMSDEQFHKMPDKYFKDIRNNIRCSLPPNFEDNAKKGPPSQEALSSDVSLLASLLGNYNPPRICNIQPLSEQSKDTLSFPNTFKPKDIKRASPPKHMRARQM